MVKKQQRTETEYTSEEREKYLFRTASEMRAILDRIEARKSRGTTDVDDSRITTKENQQHEQRNY